MVKWVNPTGDMTPARPDAVEGLGNRPQGTIQVAVGLYGKLAQLRIRWQPWLGLGWLESMAASSVAAAGARVRHGRPLGGTRGRAAAGNGLVETF